MRTTVARRRPSLLPLASLFSLVAATACGGAAPPPAVAPLPVAKPLPVAAEPPPDVTAVAEPTGLLVVGRVRQPEAILKTFGTWTRLPLPGANELVRSVADDAVADAVDLSQPVDGAVALGGSVRSPKPLVAVSVAVRSFDDARSKLSARHKVTTGQNGQLVVEGIGRASVETRGPKDEEDTDPTLCVLSPASSGARLVCGEKDAVELLSPYLTRTFPRQAFTSDVHVEVTLASVREPLAQVRSVLPILARSAMGGTTPALRQLLEAGVNEAVDYVGDTNRMTLDAQLADSGMEAKFKVEYGKADSLMVRLATSNADRADAPPAAFLHLPADTDLAAFGRGTDPKLFERPRELLGALALEATQSAGMPEAEQKAVRELVVDRMLGLFTSAVVYGKGYDGAAVDKASAALGAVKSGDVGAKDEAERVLAEQVIGWHLVRVTDPITKVGPILKDWSQLWNRPAFAKWAKQQSSSKMLAQMRVAPLPAGVALPKDAVHLEIVMPRADLEEAPPPPPPAAAGQPRRPGPVAMAKGKKVHVKPVVLHVIAVPDQGGTWLGFGMDGKLLAQKAAASLSTAPAATATLGSAAGGEALRDVKANSAWLATLRGFLVLTALDRHRSPYRQLATLNAKGATPIVFSSTSQGPSASAPGGSSTATFRLPRAAIEDVVKLILSSH